MQKSYTWLAVSVKKHTLKIAVIQFHEFSAASSIMVYDVIDNTFRQFTLLFLHYLTQFNKCS